MRLAPKTEIADLPHDANRHRAKQARLWNKKGSPVV
jgi:hypothetical protein